MKSFTITKSQKKDPALRVSKNHGNTTSFQIICKIVHPKIAHNSAQAGNLRNSLWGKCLYQNARQFVDGKDRWQENLIAGCNNLHEAETRLSRGDFRGQRKRFQLENPEGGWAGDVQLLLERYEKCQLTQIEKQWQIKKQLH